MIATKILNLFGIKTQSETNNELNNPLYNNLNILSNNNRNTLSEKTIECSLFSNKIYLLFDILSLVIIIVFYALGNPILPVIQLFFIFFLFFLQLVDFGKGCLKVLGYVLFIFGLVLTIATFYALHNFDNKKPNHELSQREMKAIFVLKSIYALLGTIGIQTIILAIFVLFDVYVRSDKNENKNVSSNIEENRNLSGQDNLHNAIKQGLISQ